MKDIAGIEIVIGDKVAATELHYVNLKVGTVIGFTPKMVKIEFPKSNNGWQNSICNKFPNQVAVLHKD